MVALPETRKITPLMKSTVTSPSDRPLVALDGGNRTINWVDPSGDIQTIPAVIKRLEEWEDAAWDEKTVLIEVNGCKYLIGETAVHLGGQPIYLSEKADSYWLMVLLALQPNPGQSEVSVQKIRILCTDSRSARFKGAQEQIRKLQTMLESESFIRNDETIKVKSIGSVDLVDEGIPAFKFAKHHRLFRWENRINGIIDIGGGDATGRLFAPNGSIDRSSDLVLPGTKRLASLISSALLKDFSYSPDTESIMDAIADGSHTLQVATPRGFEDVSFKGIFERCSEIWVDELMSGVQLGWSKVWNSIGEVLVVGGSAPLLADVEIQTQGRFKILRDAIAPQENLAQVVNVLGMLLP